MNDERETVIYDLEERTLKFAKRVRMFMKKLPKTITNIEDGKQLIRASGSIGANYIEANESLSKKDFVYRVKICKKEAKETRYWLNLIIVNNNNTLEEEREYLIKEVFELEKILASIIRKVE
ncbi:four helix bundle protein [bacterium]|nr:four helix bundle protein [FCB group bacterium]MBL7190272.1 four helix bundle protein [bacterium]